MAIKTKSDAKATFVTIKEEVGLCVWNRDTATNDPVREITGRITNVTLGSEDNEKNGKKYHWERVYVELTDVVTGEKVVLKFSQETSFNVNFWQYVTNPKFDVSKEVRIGASVSEKNPKVIFCWITLANGTKLEKNKMFPLAANLGKPKADGSQPKDYSAVLEAMNEALPKLVEQINELPPLVIETETDEELGPEEDMEIPF